MLSLNQELTQQKYTSFYLIFLQSGFQRVDVYVSEENEDSVRFTLYGINLQPMCLY